MFAPPLLTGRHTALPLGECQHMVVAQTRSDTENCPIKTGADRMGDGRWPRGGTAQPS
jgi:hypothetical protein